MTLTNAERQRAWRERRKRLTNIAQTPSDFANGLCTLTEEVETRTAELEARVAELERALEETERALKHALHERR